MIGRAIAILEILCRVQGLDKGREEQSIFKGVSVGFSEVSPFSFVTFRPSNLDNDLTCITVPLHTLLIVHSATP